MKKIPVLFLIFNRKEIAIKAFDCIRDYAPQKLYIAADGPRAEKENEYKICEDIRNSILDLIDWECEVHKLFREKNLGCAQAVYEGITWFFEHEEYGIIIEDDIVLSQDFFKVCEVLLPYYQDNSKVMMISAHNPAMKSTSSNRYTFSYCYRIWGWATWRRAWALMDMQMEGWPSSNKWRLLKNYGFFHGLIRWFWYWNNTYNNIEKCTTWATRWYFSCFNNGGLSLCTKVNLMRNIGTTGGAHYSTDDIDIYEDLRIGNVEFPIRLHNDIKVGTWQNLYDRYDFFRMRMFGLRKKFRKLVRRMK